MPVICGIDLAKSIREINSKIKIFLMIAFDTTDFKDNENLKRQKWIEYCKNQSISLI